MGQKRSGISHCGTLDALNVPSRVSGRVTAQLKMALPGVFHSETATPIGKEAFSKHRTRTAKRIRQTSRLSVQGHCWDAPASSAVCIAFSAFFSIRET